ncbi:MAG: OmpA family protein, partial [Flavobacteriales bacterium]
IEMNEEGVYNYKKLKGDKKKLVKIKNEEENLKAILERGELPKVYYNLNSSHLRAKSADKLDQIIEKMKNNEQLKLEINSYTDSRGDDKYNMKLSQQRTKGVISFLVSKGISKDRLKGKGFGENKLVNECKDGVECPDKKHQMNRRTEFRFYKD